MTECRMLQKALNELTNKGQIDSFLKHGVRAFEKGKGKSLNCPTRNNPRR